jgi:hypothetical protein
MRGKPARNREIATMVGTSAMAIPTAHPLSDVGSASCPANAAMTQKAMAPPDMITALAPTAGTELMTLSPRSM